LEELNLEKNKSIVTVRPEETYAAYMLQDKSVQRSVTEEVVKNLLEFGRNLQIVMVGRYDRKSIRRWRKLGKEVRVTESIIDGPSLVAQSSLFIGAGGTMTAEAALLGVPTVSVYPAEPTFVEKYLIKVGLVYRSLDPKRAASTGINMMYDIHCAEKHRKISRRLLSSMEDPIAKIEASLLKLESR
jgi:predicted glycosyltransferase